MCCFTYIQCKRRLRKLGQNGDFYFASLDGNLVLDAGPMGSDARFANHSCDPNIRVSILYIYTYI